MRPFDSTIADFTPQPQLDGAEFTPDMLVEFRDRSRQMREVKYAGTLKQPKVRDQIAQQLDWCRIKKLPHAIITEIQIRKNPRRGTTSTSASSFAYRVGAMSRISDTRFRTREAAARLVTAGRQTHEMTVDLIYAEIRQGSRTTINDELKLWKDEQTKVDALRAALPRTVADAMLTTWATAVEHGEKVFSKRSEEIEQEMAKAQDRSEQLQGKLADLQRENEVLQGELDHSRNELSSIREEVSSERSARETALRHNWTF